MRRAKKEVESDLNLLPIMNLFVALVPFLLVGTAFFHMQVINVSVPTNSNEPASTKIVRKSSKNAEVVMTVQITKKGFKVFGICEDLPTKEVESFTKTFGRKRKFNFEGLSRFLANIKRKYKKSNTVIVVPDKNIPYWAVIRTIDAARKLKLNEKDIFMFTNVVVSSKV
jgi:biopolymer transport protein ExbD